MRILIAPDKFKEVLPAARVAEQIAAGLREALPGAEISTMPVADGGEGTADAICSARGGEWHQRVVQDSLGQPVSASYCTIAHGEVAVLEVSQACGLWRVPGAQRDPELASSSGVGEMLRDATARGAKRIILGLGGSATNDGGLGMARALGFRFLDAQGAELHLRVSELLRLHAVEWPNEWHLPEIVAAVDVQVPLLGERGATRMFAAQKGATGEQIPLLERSLARLAEVIGSDAHLRPGAGAAGGLGFGLVAFCGATIRSGFEVVAEQIGLAAAVEQADVVITGEGRLDAQTLEGKAPAGVARLARELGKRCFALVGELEAAGGVCELFDEVVVLKPAEMSRMEAKQMAPALLRERARQLGLRL
ncbi:glycerate kinase [soil metagenome]